MSNLKKDKDIKNAELEIEITKNGLKHCKNNVVRFTAEEETVKAFTTKAIEVLLEENLELFAKYKCKIQVKPNKFEITIPVGDDITSIVPVNLDELGIYDVAQSIIHTSLRLKTTPDKNRGEGIVHFLTEDVMKGMIYINVIVQNMRIYKDKWVQLKEATRAVQNSGELLNQIQICSAGTRRLKGLLPLRVAAKLTEESAETFLKQFDTKTLRAQVVSTFGIPSRTKLNKKEMIQEIINRLYE